MSRTATKLLVAAIFDDGVKRSLLGGGDRSQTIIETLVRHRTDGGPKL